MRQSLIDQTLMDRAAPRDFVDPYTVLYLPFHNMEFGRSAELLTNGGMEIGDPPTGWTLQGAGAAWVQSTEQKYAGTYSGKLTRAGTNCYFLQNYADYAKYKGLTATLKSWVYATAATRARIFMSDGVTDTSSGYHTGGSSWEQLSITKAIAATADRLRGCGRIDDGDTSAYYDAISMYIDNLAMSQDAYGHLVQNSGTLWTPQGRIIDGIDDVITVVDSVPIQDIFDSPGGTVWGWINPSSDGEGSLGRIIGKSGADNVGWFLFLQNEAVGFALLSFWTMFSTTTGRWVHTGNFVPINKPSMVGVSYNSSSVTNDPILTVDGIPYAISETTPVGARRSDVATPLTIGNNAATTRTFDGLIGEIGAVKGRMLQPPELQRIFQATKWRYGR